MVCLGSQVACIIDAIGEVRPNLTWFAADVEPVCAEAYEPFGSPTPAVIGASDAAASFARGVDQFLFGVFIAVEGDATGLRLRDSGRLSNFSAASSPFAVASMGLMPSRRTSQQRRCAMASSLVIGWLPTRIQERSTRGLR